MAGSADGGLRHPFLEARGPESWQARHDFGDGTWGLRNIGDVWVGGYRLPGPSEVGRIDCSDVRGMTADEAAAEAIAVSLVICAVRELRAAHGLRSAMLYADGRAPIDLDEWLAGRLAALAGPRDG